MFFLEKDEENYVSILSTDEVSVSKEQGTFGSVGVKEIIFKKKFLIEFWMYLDNFVCSNRMYDSVNNFFIPSDKILLHFILVQIVCTTT